MVVDRNKKWQNALGIAAILVTVGLYSFSALADSHDKIYNTIDRVSVVEKREDSHDTQIQKQGESLTKIDKEVLVAVTILKEMQKHSK